MSKASLIESMKSRGFSQAEADRAIDGVTAAIREVTDRKDPVRLPGLGTFNMKRTAEKQARNPRTGETITVAPKDKLTFKEGKR